MSGPPTMTPASRWHSVARSTPTGTRRSPLFGSEHQRTGDASLELQGLALSVNRVFYREGRVNPFMSFGIAQINSILKPGADDSAISALYGVGLLITLGAERDDGSAMQLRADLGGRRALSTDIYFEKPIDYVAGLGIQYSWGGSAPRAGHGRRRR